MRYILEERLHAEDGRHGWTWSKSDRSSPWRGRGTEEAYCRRMGLDPAILAWYQGLEFLDSLRWVLKLGKPYEIHTAESLQRDLQRWLEEN